MADVSHRGSRTRGLFVDVTDFGATGDGSTDDRAAIQRAIDAVAAAGRGEVYFPEGTYRVTRSGSNFYCLLLKSGVKLVGESQTETIIKQAASIVASVRILYCTNAVDAGIDNLTLDGNKAAQSVSEHRHGLFVDGAQGLEVKDVISQNFTGDGFYVSIGSEDITFERCTATANNRNGLTLGAVCDDILITACTLTGNAVQGFDIEPGAGNVVSNVTVRGNTIGGPVGGGAGYAFAGGGPDSATLATGIRFLGNTFTGSLIFTWCDDVTFRGNTVTVSDGESPCFHVYRTNTNFEVRGNTFHMARTNHHADGTTVVRLESTGVGNQPDDIRITHNQITLDETDGVSVVGIGMRGALNATVEYNTITGVGGTGAFDSGVAIRGTVAGEAISVRYNTITNFGTTGVKVYDGTGNIDSIDISYNTISDTQTTPTMTTGVSLDDGTDVALELTCIDNVISDSIVTKYAWPTDVSVLFGRTHEGHLIYVVDSSPEGNLTASPGAIAIVQTAGVFGASYEKTSGTGSTGWTLVT